jgi:4,5-DOPA dioxygenase extradiol
MPLFASGSLTHNLYEYRGNGPPEPYAAAYAAWVRRAHPTPEHFWPLLIAVGAAEEA